MTSQINDASQDSKNMALILWIGSIFFGFIPGLIFYLVQKDDSYIQDQAKVVPPGVLHYGSGGKL